MIKSYKELADVFKPDFIVVTGDFRHFTKNKKYDLALKFLNELSKIFSLKKESFFLVPGNHDTNRFNMRNEIIDSIRGQVEKNADVYYQYIEKKLLQQGFKEYSNFIKLFFENSVNDERTENPSGVYNIVWEDKLNILTLNTALISNGAEERCEIVDIQTLSKLIDKINIELPTIVLAHHDIDSLVSSHKTHLERLLPMINTRVYLCGDKHIISREMVNKYDIGENFPCIVCGKSAVQLDDDYSDVCVIGYTWDGAETSVEVYKWLNKNEDNPFQFIKSDKWIHHINKSFTFKMTDEEILESNSAERIEETWKNFLNAFESEDEIICKKLDNKGVKNKTNNYEKFSSAKIMTSLIKIGIPFPAIAEITEIAIDKLINWIDKISIEKCLDTKTVREMVLEAINSLPDDKWTTDIIGKWSTKYIHRYGHNNKIVQIYNIPNTLAQENVNEANYRFIKEIFLPDLFQTTSPTLNIHCITNSQKTSLANEIISLINECDLYRIDYNILKQIVHEIATQPPHPWLINDNQRQSLIEYDMHAVETNYKKMVECEENNKSIPHTVFFELLHHTSSMILDRYFSFCGCDDLDSFSILYQYLKKMIKASMSSTEWDQILSDRTLRKLYEDFTINKIEFTDYYEKICALNPSKMKKQKTNNFIESLKWFVNSSLTIVKYNTTVNQKIKQFLINPWSNYKQIELNQNIATILSFLFPTEMSGENSKLKNIWWHKYISCYSTQLPKMKKSVFVVVQSNDEFEEGVLNCLANEEYKDVCNTIFFIKEHYNNKQKCRKSILAMLSRMGLNYYTPILFEKRDLSSIMKCSTKKSICFDNIVLEQMKEKMKSSSFSN